MPVQIFTVDGHPDITAALAGRLEAETGCFELRRFPDGESYLRIDSDVAGVDAVVVCTLDRPDPKTLTLLFFASTLRKLGARRVGLVAPYLAYMRQDAVFRPGESVTSRHFAALLSDHFDWLATVDPHLHRYDSLDEIYRIPSEVVAAAPALAATLRIHSDALLVGPDAESEQWVADIASRAGLPWAIAKKTRRGDRDVAIELPELDRSVRRAIVVDDVISSGATMAQTLTALTRLGFDSSLCACVHPVFAEGAATAIDAAGATGVLSANTIVHPSNAVDIGPALGDAAARLNGG